MKKRLLVLCAVAAVWAGAEQAAASCPVCDSDYNNCLRGAAVGREECYNTCALHFPPGPDRDSCRQGCQGEYTAVTQGCASQYYNCQNSCPPCCFGNPPNCPGSASCNTSSCQWECVSPILLDRDRGFQMTSAADGVLFDAVGDGRLRPVAWTARGSDASWLVLDRNGNGTIDDGSELFGSATPQPPPGKGELKNGFAALRVYDDPALGGNGDDFIDARDAIFASLRLWRDDDHDGETDPGELKTLASRGVARFALRYRIADRVDEFGNAFYLKGWAFDGAGQSRGIFLWDVFLTIVE